MIITNDTSRQREVSPNWSKTPSWKAEQVDCVSEIRKQKRGGMHAATLAGVGVLPTNDARESQRRKPWKKNTARATTDSSLGHTRAAIAYHIRQHAFRAIPLPTTDVNIILYFSERFFRGAQASCYCLKHIQAKSDAGLLHIMVHTPPSLQKSNHNTTRESRPKSAPPKVGGLGLA